MRKRTTYTLLVVFLVLCALAAALYLRQKAPPEVARLLPESDAIVYFDLKPLRLATHFDKNTPPPAPAYQQFVNATGILLERDLNKAAFALHRMPDPNGPNGPVAFSEVFTGHFDTDRLTRYLAGMATATEPYASRTIYSIPMENRTLRIAILDYETVAASNAPTPEQLHSIIDRSRAAASPFSGSSLLSARYADVPAFSSAWAIGHIGLPFGENGKVNLAGLQLPIPTDTTFVASLRYTTALHLRIDQLTADEAAATQSAQNLSNLLTLFRQLQPSAPQDPAVSEFVNSIKIKPETDRATLTATLPTDLLKRFTRSPGTP